MNLKPTILVISHRQDFSQRESIIRLRKEYQFYFYKIRQKENIKEQVKNIEKLIKEQKIKVSGVIFFNDQTSLLASVINKKLNLLGPSPLSLVKIQNKEKFLNRLKNKNFLPPTKVINLKKKNHKISQFPIFVKPVKGSMSEGAIKISDKQQLESFLRNPPKVYHRKPELSFFLRYSPKSDLNLFISQPYIDERQFTLEGFVHNKEVSLLSITESIYDKNRKSFIRFDFPIEFNDDINKELQSICQEIINLSSFNNSLFNLEFFLDKNNKISVIEMNSRSAFVFEPFYNNYYQIPLIKMACQLSLGEKPIIKLKKDRKICRSYILRKNTNQLINQIPTPSQIKNILDKYQISQIKILCQKGKRLSQQKQDEYSFRYGVIDICGCNHKEIEERYNKSKKEIDKLIIFSPIYH